MSEAVPYAAQLDAVRREISMRQRVYPRWVEGGRMTQKKADAEIAAMRAILRTLELVDAINRDLLEAGPARADFALSVSLCGDDGAAKEGLEDSIAASIDSLFIDPADLGQLL